ncbi:MAG: WXG100 family type VII secretion target, partial [Anaerolineae bacterium]
MTRIHVSPAQLYAAAHRFRASAHEVRSAARQMRAALEAAPWQGVARNRFGDRFREWEAEA